MDKDVVLAIQLQEQFDFEASSYTPTDDNYGQTSKKMKVESSSNDVIPYLCPS
jgi:hypothetical protein